MEPSMAAANAGESCRRRPLRNHRSDRLDDILAGTLALGAKEAARAWSTRASDRGVRAGATRRATSGAASRRTAAIVESEGRGRPKSESAGGHVAADLT